MLSISIYLKTERILQFWIILWENIALFSTRPAQEVNIPIIVTTDHPFKYS